MACQRKLAGELDSENYAKYMRYAVIKAIITTTARCDELRGVRLQRDLHNIFAGRIVDREIRVFDGNLNDIRIVPMLSRMDKRIRRK